MVVAVDRHLDQALGRTAATMPTADRPVTSSSPRGPTSTVTNPGAFEQRVGGTRHHEPAAVDHHDVVAHLLHVVEEVSGHQHRDAERAETGNEHQHLLAAQWVEARGRLVEQHQLGIADQRLGQLGALTHAGREPADRPEPGLVEPDEVEDVGCPLASGAGRQAR